MDDLAKERFGADAAHELCRVPGLFKHGRLYRRVEINDVLRSEFVKRGGDAATSRDDVALVLKKWLVGSASPFRKERRGRYRFSDTNGSTHQSLVRDHQGSDGDVTRDGGGLEPARALGEGPYEVYAWCLPRYQDTSGGRWPIKIGRAGPDGLRRRLRDFQENLPERPSYLLRLGCANDREARDMEALLHAWFRNRGQKLDSAPGEEWFATNPKEIEEAVLSITGCPN